MSPTDKEDDSSKFPDDLRHEWADENREIEGRRPDLEETEEDTSAL